MEQIENMEQIESAQRELCLYLLSMMPVDWSRVCLYSECENGILNNWIALVEKETGLLCTQESFWQRYHSYPYAQAQAAADLDRYCRDLYNAYLERFGADKTWCTYYLTISDDYSFHADLGYEMPAGSAAERRAAVIRKFCGTDPHETEGKYPR